MEILNVGIGELLLIAVIALLVFGPERLPEVLREGARLWGQLRGVSDELQRTLLNETRPIRDTLEETRREIEASARPITEFRDELDRSAREIDSAAREVRDITRNPLARERDADGFKAVSRSPEDDDGDAG